MTGWYWNLSLFSLSPSSLFLCKAVNSGMCCDGRCGLVQTEPVICRPTVTCHKSKRAKTKSSSFLRLTPEETSSNIRYKRVRVLPSLFQLWLHLQNYLHSSITTAKCNHVHLSRSWVTHKWSCDKLKGSKFVCSFNKYFFYNLIFL